MGAALTTACWRLQGVQRVKLLSLDFDGVLHPGDAVAEID